MNEEWEAWYEMLEHIADDHGESVADADAWFEEFEQGKSPEDAFYGEYPEHKVDA